LSIKFINFDNNIYNMDTTTQIPEMSEARKKLIEVVRNAKVKKGRMSVWGIVFFEEDYKKKVMQMNELRDELIKIWKKALGQIKKQYDIKYYFEIWDDGIYLVLFWPLEKENDNCALINNKCYMYGKEKVLDIKWDDNELLVYYPNF